MGSIFALPPARAELEELPGNLLALVPDAESTLRKIDLKPPLVVCVGAERDGLPAELVEAAAGSARIPIRSGGPDSLNAAMAATVALYELGHRITRS